jgi:hypothetical protein
MAEPPRVIMCERTGAWAIALQREPALAGMRLAQRRSLGECWEELARRPASFLVVELTGTGVDFLLARLARLGRDFPLARAAVVAEPGLREYEALLREAGAAWFAVSPRDLAPLAQMAARHLELAPRPQLGPAQRIWESLPWGAAKGVI